MKRRLIGILLALGLIATIPLPRLVADSAAKPETLTMADIKSGAGNFKGEIREVTIEEEESPKEELFRKYGTRTFNTFEKHREIVASLKKLYPKFNPHTMGTSDPNQIVTFNDRTLLILIGCYPHNCGGTHQLVAIEPATKRVYLLQPVNVGPDTTPSGKFLLYGDPDPDIRAAMFKAYPVPQD